MKIKSVRAQEIIDSRDDPTVEAEVTLEDGSMGRAAVPSGASTGKYEALELRDDDKKRFLGKGVLKAVENVNSIIAPELVGMDTSSQRVIDYKIIELDGTEHKENLGANAILAVSMAFCRATAAAEKIPLYQRVANIFGHKIDKFTMPIPMMNVLNGGKHALGSSDMQEYMIMPVGAKSIAEAVRWGTEVFDHLGMILKKMGFQITVGDEGGYAPSLGSNEEPLKLIVKAIEAAGYKPGKQIAIAMDPAASEFYENGKYNLKVEKRKLSSAELIDYYIQLAKKYPIISIEDGLAEDDWDGFVLMMKKLGDKMQLVGDDLFVTNVKRLKQGIKLKAANSILIKLNQIGTVTETIKAMKLAKENKMTSIVSHRSGETEDTFIADFVVGAGTGQIKTGSLQRSDRVAKYNQLMRIEKELGEKAVMGTI